jgi:cation-transporting ATPase 13A2
MSESVPTSVTSFAHRRRRADSTTSFTYYPDEGAEDPQVSDEDVILDDEQDTDDDRYEEDSVDLEAGELAPMRRVSSAHSRGSVHDRLLRSDSTKTDASGVGRSGRMSQKIYIVNEDLTIVVAGFRTSTVGFAMYTAVCIATFGLAFLLLRWIPRWQVRLVGSPSPLRDCTWVVIEASIALFRSEDRN